MLTFARAIRDSVSTTLACALFLVSCSPPVLPVPVAKPPAPTVHAEGTETNPDRTILREGGDTDHRLGASVSREGCTLQPVVAPTPPAELPGYAELDPATGLHVTGQAPILDLERYTLVVRGKVARPLALTYDDLRCLPRTETRCLLVCTGFFEDEATWAGTPLAGVLQIAGVLDGASGIRLVGADGYNTRVSLSAATAESAFLAFAWENEPLPILHGFPVRAVFPELEGNRWAKWLVEIEVY